VVTNGALSQLPFSLLVTTASAPAAQSLRFAELREVPWLIRQVAVSHLPSAATIVTLRHARPGSAVRRDFIGFGDPDFGGGRRPAVRRGITIRNLDFKRPPPPKSGVAVAPAWLDYSRIPALPDTRDEILAIARALHADPVADVRLGKAASLKNAHSAELARRRIVAFATHGLLPGDFPGVDQPSLALANPGGGRLGLLTLEQILGLKLDADWVVLSACNTAAGDGAGAEAISGLGRGFFYAGSRALLVTHWPVETASARLLVSGVFSRYGSDPSLGRAQALRLSILDLIDSAGAVNPKTGKADFSYAHPLFWAPYVVVGDGGRTTIP
jgi:CHAT domain-containing protein